MKKTKITKILVANRSEIAIRVIRAAHELDIESVAIYSEEDRLALHRFKAHEAYQVGVGKSAVEAYLDIDDILRIAKSSGCNALHPGYGFLSENPDFAEQCRDAGLVFIGPDPDVMRKLGNKVNARKLAEEADVPVIPASPPLNQTNIDIPAVAKRIGLPLMLKASWGGGGRGMRIIREQREIKDAVQIGQREALAYFGNDEIYFEKLLENVSHVEVQILGDHHGNVVHLFERDCSLQRRHQKVIERAPAPYLDENKRRELCAAAVRLARHAGLNNAATIEFLYDKNEEKFYFIEVNPRLQVEHTVTEEITGIDIVKAQIKIAGGHKIGSKSSLVPAQAKIRRYAHAMQCRVTTEDPQNNFIPDHGHIVSYRSPAGPGIRLDGGTAYTGAWTNRSYDSLLVKITTRGRTQEETISRMRRGLSEFRIRGVATNLPFLLQMIAHPKFRTGEYNTRFIDETPDLFEFARTGGKVERLLKFIGDVSLNGNKDTSGRPRPHILAEVIPPPLPDILPPPGLKQVLMQDGTDAVIQHIRQQTQPLVTDTTFRDAHQSLLATRLRSKDLVAIAPHYARLMPALFSVESWGGATFDVAMRFLNEDPWQRLHDLSQAMPNIMQQMLLRASNAVGYKNYPDNVVEYFINEAAGAGVDVFRIFDSLNWFENMTVAIEAAGKTGKLVEAAICYTGDILDPKRTTYTLDYYLKLARQLENAGAHILGIKDMAGLLKPAAAQRLIGALKQEVSIPIHFHTHDTSGVAAASVLSAVDAGVDIFDAAIDSMSGLTSQPNMGSIIEALRNTPKQTEIDVENVRLLSHYWENVRQQYSAFEPDMRAGASEVYVHEMPGGQYTNLREQARSLGIESRWPEIAQAYSDVNDMFGDIVKVTPTSKVVGDMALAMVTAGHSKEDILDPDKHIAFPESVISFFRGELGLPAGGFPQALQKKVLNGEKPLDVRPGSVMENIDIEASRQSL
ncbi:MAG: pyruvate carboxylase, partial [Gammaproteobacteria bacterium]